MRKQRLFPICLLALACSSESPETPSNGSPSGGANAGGTASAGTGGARAGTSAGGAGEQSSGSGGASGASAGTASGGSAAGVAGTSAGGSSAGGSSANGGTPAAGSGGSGGAAGTGSTDANVAKALDGVRIDAPCAGTPAGTDGETCNHPTLMDNAFEANKEVSLGGNMGTTYDVTLRIRGVVEPTSISGGMRPDTSTITYKNAMWRKVPYTIGGTLAVPDYQAWRLRVSEPKQDYFLNDYQKTAHNTFALDYQVTIQVAAGSKVTLGVIDSNEREIVNYEKYSVDGIDGAMNLGQFVQINVVSAEPR